MEVNNWYRIESIEQSPTEIDQIMEYRESKGEEVLGELYHALKEGVEVE